MSTRRRLRRTLAAVAATIALPVAGVVAPAAAHADGGPGGIVVSTDGTICWEKGGAGNRPTVIVRLSEIAKDPVTVVLDTVNGTAVAPDDYVAISGLLVTVPAGASSVQVPLDIVADAVVEPDEWFFVSLSKPSVGQIGKNPATVIIKDGAPPAAAR